MQLSRSLSVLAVVIGTAVAASGDAAAESGAGTTNTFFHESGGGLDMTVFTPSARASVDLGESVTVTADWEADIVSGASVAIVDAPAPRVDAITSATTLDDVRHTVGGSLTLRDQLTSFTAGYAYGFESDYRSHGLRLGARTELFERNTAFDLSYARGFDSVCNLYQPRAQEAVDRARLPSSDGCFSDEETRESVDLSLQTFQGTWTQAWTAILTTQLTLTAQLLHGYQGNPYRAVWLGRRAAQEHHPSDRARYAAGLGARLWIKPLEGALQLFGRVYRDSWDIRSITGEIAYVQSMGESLRLRARARYYAQSGAVFYSDDYLRAPAGQYFTGDRELSPMSSVTLGAQLDFEVPANDEGEVLGFLGSLELVLKVDYIMHTIDDFHYGQAPVPNEDAIVATIGVEAVL